MLTSLFKTKPILEPGIQDWILDTFSWALENFSKHTFYQDTQLVLPTNDFYPGKVSSVHEMALAIFENTQKYAALEDWPMVLVSPQVYQQESLPLLDIKGELRGKTCEITKFDQQKLKLTYNPAQINQPQDLIATFAQNFAYILILQSGKLPPGGKENIPQAADLLACMMGFGVMMANTAYQFKGGCGSCFNAAANRQAALPETEVIYILTLFCVLKSIPIKEVLPHLKSHMKNSFKSSYKEIQQLVKTSPDKWLQ